MKSFFSIFALLALLTVIGCSDDETTGGTGSLKLNISGLESLGTTAQYEGWIVVNGVPKSTGTFTVDGSGALSKTTFDVGSDDLSAATAFVLTIESIPDHSAAPSDVHFLGGDFSGSGANLNIAHSAAIGSNFASATGKYILATPTDGMNNNEKSGIWFLDLVGGSPIASLNLPTLPAGWKYEGWGVVNGTPVSTGTFTNVSAVDDAAPYSGGEAAPPFPGEDFLLNAPAGLTFPTDLSGTTVVISVEPDPDNSPAPFTLKPLSADVSATAADNVPYPLNFSNASFPTGTATR